MEKQRFAFAKINYILLAVGIGIIILGFILMSGSSTTLTHFNEDIFSFRRIKLAPVVCFSGFIFCIYAILKKPAEEKE